jgi:hypothetical protein
MRNGFEICESSGCVHAANFDFEIGKSIVKERLKDRAWALLDYKLQYDLHDRAQRSAHEAEAVDPDFAEVGETTSPEVA